MATQTLLYLKNLENLAQDTSIQSKMRRKILDGVTFIF